MKRIFGLLMAALVLGTGVMRVQAAERSEQEMLKERLDALEVEAVNTHIFGTTLD